MFTKDEELTGDSILIHKATSGYRKTHKSPEMGPSSLEAWLSKPLHMWRLVSELRRYQDGNVVSMKDKNASYVGC